MYQNNLDGDIFTVRLGLPGEGKSLAQTELDVIPLLYEGLEVYCTYWINWNRPNLHLFTEFDEIKYIRNAVVVFDEIGSILDPRNWDAEDSGVRTFFQQHRHRAVDIIANTQHISLIAKSALIEIKQFLVCTKSWNGWFLKEFFPNFPWLVIKEEEYSIQELKKLENGNLSIANDMEDDTESELVSTRNSQTIWFSKKELYHRELDEYKIELVHRFCTKCKSRQGDPIPKDETINFAIFDNKKDTYVLLEDVDLGKCPKHKDHDLIIKESSMYDTRYEVVPVEKEIIFKPYYKTIKEAPFKGSLTQEQFFQKTTLEKNARSLRN